MAITLLTQEPTRTSKCVVMTGVTAHTTIATSTAIPIGAFTQGGFWSATVGTKNLTYYVCDTIDGTYKLLASNANASITIAATSNSAIPFRSECFAFAFLKILHADTITTDLVVTLKS